MDFFDFLLYPGIIIGSIVGIGATVLLHWLFTAADLLFAQVLLVVLFAGIGFIIQLNIEPRNNQSK